jgi:hypothetical protein
MSISLRATAPAARAISVPEIIAALQSYFIMWILHCSIPIPYSQSSPSPVLLLSRAKVRSLQTQIRRGFAVGGQIARRVFSDARTM